MDARGSGRATKTIGTGRVSGAAQGVLRCDYQRKEVDGNAKGEMQKSKVRKDTPYAPRDVCILILPFAFCLLHSDFSYLSCGRYDHPASRNRHLSRTSLL